MGESVPRGRLDRIESRERYEKWRRSPYAINSETCINCDACVRHCPPALGAVFNRGFKELYILPELCSGCQLCVRACPVDSIHPRPEWSASPEDDWALPGSHDDPYR